MEYAAMRWLWLEKDCHYLLEQRSPRYQNGSPDVIGVTCRRKVIEIEIKRSMSDFRADFKKPHRVNRHLFLDEMPNQFYYMVPENLVDKVLPELPDWAGLIRWRFGPVVEVVKVSPVNKLSKKLSINECVRMTRMMVNHMMGYALIKMSGRQHFESADWVDHEQGTYNI